MNQMHIMRDVLGLLHKFVKKTQESFKGGYKSWNAHRQETESKKIISKIQRRASNNIDHFKTYFENEEDHRLNEPAVATRHAHEEGNGTESIIAQHRHALLKPDRNATYV